MKFKTSFSAVVAMVTKFQTFIFVLMRVEVFGCCKNAKIFIVLRNAP